MWLGIQTRKQYLRLQEDFRKAEGGMLRCSAAEYWGWPGWPGWQKKHRVDNCSKRSRRWWLFTTPLLYKTIQNLFDGSLGAPFFSHTKKDQVRTHTTANFGFGVGSYCGFAADCHDTSGRITRLCFQDPYKIPTKPRIFMYSSPDFKHIWISMDVPRAFSLLWSENGSKPRYAIFWNEHPDLSWFIPAILCCFRMNIGTKFLPGSSGPGWTQPSSITSEVVSSPCRDTSEAHRSTWMGEWLKCIQRW